MARFTTVAKQHYRKTKSDWIFGGVFFFLVFIFYYIFIKYTNVVSMYNVNNVCRVLQVCQVYDLRHLYKICLSVGTLCRTLYLIFPYESRNV